MATAGWLCPQSRKAQASSSRLLRPGGQVHRELRVGGRLWAPQTQGCQNRSSSSELFLPFLGPQHPQALTLLAPPPPTSTGLPSHLPQRYHLGPSCNPLFGLVHPMFCKGWLELVKISKKIGMTWLLSSSSKNRGVEESALGCTSPLLGEGFKSR